MTSLSLKLTLSTNTTSRQNKVYIRPHRHRRTIWIITHLRSYGRNMWLLENLKTKDSPSIAAQTLCLFIQFNKKTSLRPIPILPPDKTCVVSIESLYIPILVSLCCYNVLDFILKTAIWGENELLIWTVSCRSLKSWQLHLKCTMRLTNFTE